MICTLATSFQPVRPFFPQLVVLKDQDKQRCERNSRWETPRCRVGPSRWHGRYLPHQPFFFCFSPRKFGQLCWKLGLRSALFSLRPPSISSFEKNSYLRATQSWKLSIFFFDEPFPSFHLSVPAFFLPWFRKYSECGLLADLFFIYFWLHKISSHERT